MWHLFNWNITNIIEQYLYKSRFWQALKSHNSSVQLLWVSIISVSSFRGAVALSRKSVQSSTENKTGAGSCPLHSPGGLYEGSESTAAGPQGGYLSAGVRSRFRLCRVSGGSFLWSDDHHAARWRCWLQTLTDRNKCLFLCVCVFSVKMTIRCCTGIFVPHYFLFLSSDYSIGCILWQLSLKGRHDPYRCSCN